MRTRRSRMSRNIIPWLMASSAAVAILYFGGRSRRSGANRDRGSAHGPLDTASDSEVRNAALKYRPVGGSGDPYPDWVRMLDGKSGVYILREIQRDGSTEVVYVGQSS